MLVCVCVRIFAAQLYLHVSTEEGLTFVLQFTVTVVNAPVTIERKKKKQLKKEVPYYIKYVSW